jgi:hypothetical protein
LPDEAFGSADVPEEGSSCGSSVVCLFLRDAADPSSLDHKPKLDLGAPEDAEYAGSCGSFVVELAEGVCWSLTEVAERLSDGSCRRRPSITLLAKRAIPKDARADHRSSEEMEGVRPSCNAETCVALVLAAEAERCSGDEEAVVDCGMVE